MRIISGKFKGRLIKVPDSKLIRPTTDRVRETLFNLLNNRIDFADRNILDIYAGSGSLGLECLSRGAAEVHFVEKNFVIYRNLQENINSVNAEGSCTIFKMDAVRFTETIKNQKYDIILADPPFFKDDIYVVAENIIKNDLLADEDSIFIIERSVQTREKDVIGLRTEPFKVIGDTCLYEIKKNSAEQ
jgi:16S rRNA (guanine966-N2)-methyltransferase